MFQGLDVKWPVRSHWRYNPRLESESTETNTFSSYRWPWRIFQSFPLVIPQNKHKHYVANVEEYNQPVKCLVALNTVITQELEKSGNTCGMQDLLHFNKKKPHSQEGEETVGLWVTGF